MTSLNPFDDVSQLAPQNLRDGMLATAAFGYRVAHRPYITPGRRAHFYRRMTVSLADKR